MSNTNIFLLPIGGGGEEIEKLSLNVSENGNYEAAEGTAYTEVNVNVPKVDTSVVSSVISAAPVSFTAIDVKIKVASNKTMTSYGVDYSTDNFQTYQSVTNNGTYFGQKTITVAGLTSGTTYQVRSFVVVEGIRYDQEPFNTIATASIPVYPVNVPAKATMMTTTNLSSSLTVRMGYGSFAMPDENFYVDWGDGSEIQIYMANTTSSITHTYSTTGNKTIYCWSDSTTDTEYGKMPPIYNTQNGLYNSWQQIKSIDTPLQKIYGGSTHYSGRYYMFYDAKQLKFVCSDLLEYCFDKTKPVGNYSGMFRGCSALTTAPALTATTLSKSCYEDMFYECSSLTVAPELPATTLTSMCYYNMFFGCTSLTAAPELPATTLVVNCYSGMFRNCTSLTTAPELPATTLVSSCYDEMFQDCTKLQSVTTYVTDWNITHAERWLSGAGTNAENPTVYCPADSTIPSGSTSGIPTRWSRADLVI